MKLGESSAASSGLRRDEADLESQSLQAIFDFTGPRRPDRSPPQLMRRALALLGDPQRVYPVVHVGGTSGKTSTAYAIRALLESAGFRTGLTVSPHINSLGERVQIGGQPLSRSDFAQALDEMLAVLAPLRGQLTYFELVCALAFTVFAREKVDYGVVEVGIGGQRDATNVFERADKLAVITPIGLDHTEKLGKTIAEIAAQKAGIIPEAGVGFVGPQLPAARAVIAERAALVGAHLEWVAAPTTGPDWSGVPTYQRENWALALAVVSYLSERDHFALPEPGDLVELRRVQPPARYEWFDLDGKRLLLDGAHNPQKMTGLVKALADDQLAPLPTLVTLSDAPLDKAVATLSALAPAVSKLIISEFQLGQGAKVKASLPAAELARIAADLGLPSLIERDLRRALADLLAEDSPTVLVTGSLYLAALVRPLLDLR